MSPRKRRFETLEDRRLLSVLVGAPASPTSAPSAAAEIAPSAPPVAPSSADSTSNDSISSSEADSTDNPAEYADSAPATIGNPTNDASPSSASPGYAYAPTAYDNSYASTYATNTSYSYSNYSKSPASTSPSSPSTSVQPTSAVPTLQAVNSNNHGTTADSFAVLLPNAGAAPAAANSPPAARTPSSESLHVEQESLTSVAEPVAMPTVEGADLLMAPVAQSDFASDWDRLAARTAAVAEWFARAEPLLPAAEAGARSLLVGSIGAPFATLEDGIDAVFERFDRLGSDLADHAQVSRIGQWLILAGGACAAFEYARARYREGGTWQATSYWPILCEPRLRRRWFGGRSRGR
jgi:hypothetical protein